MISPLNNHSPYSNFRDTNFILSSFITPQNNSQIKYFRILRFCHITSHCPNKRAISIKGRTNINSLGIKKYEERKLPYMEVMDKC